MPSHQDNLAAVREGKGPNKAWFKKGHPGLYEARGKDHCQFKHGQYGTTLYKKWMSMKRRCLNQNDHAYARYGAKGVTVCHKWLDFAGFYEDMAPTFKVGLTIDRIDNTKGYSKENFRWASVIEQARNKRNVKKYAYRGKELTIPELAQLAGVTCNTMRARLKTYGWSVEFAVATPNRLKK